MIKQFKYLCFLFLVLFFSCKEANQSPECVITEPDPGSTYQPGEIVSVIIEASDPDGTVTGVKLYIDDTEVYSTSESPYEYDWNTMSETYGSHTIKAVVTDDQGDTGSDEISVGIITEAGTPVVLTKPATSVSFNSATTGGTVVDAGGASVTDKGVCWNTSINPSTDDDFLSEGSGTGDFSIQITGLSASTTYYLRAYAINSKGTAYGGEIHFTTGPDPNLGWSAGVDWVDGRDNLAYPTIQIGDQVWMLANMKFKTSTGTWYYDNDSSTYAETHGRLYTWEVASDVCPDDWHLPSDEEWKTLEKELGMSQSDADQIGWRGTDQGTQLKLEGTSGFDATLSGKRTVLTNFSSIDDYGYYMTSTEATSIEMYIRSFYSNSTQVRRDPGDKGDAFSIRCVKDE